MKTNKTKGYGKRKIRLHERIAAKIEDPKTSLDDIGALVSRSKVLIKECREYLRSVRESIQEEEEK